MKNLKTPREFKQAVQVQLEGLADLDQQMYKTAQDILRNPKNFTGHDSEHKEVERLAGVETLFSLLSASKKGPNYSLSVLSHLTREDRIGLYPITHIRYAAAEDLKELFAVSEKIPRKAKVIGTRSIDAG